MFSQNLDTESIPGHEANISIDPFVVFHQGNPGNDMPQRQIKAKKDK